MSDHGLDDLDRDDWDYSRAETRPSGSSPRAVVSVAFPRADFDAVSEFARSNDMKVSEFIREAVMDRIRSSGGTRVPVTISTSQPGPIRGSSTRASLITRTTREPVTT